MYFGESQAEESCILAYIFFRTKDFEHAVSFSRLEVRRSNGKEEAWRYGFSGSRQTGSLVNNVATHCVGHHQCSKDRFTTTTISQKRPLSTDVVKP